MHKVGELMQL